MTALMSVGTLIATLLGAFAIVTVALLGVEWLARAHLRAMRILALIERRAIMELYHEGPALARWWYTFRREMDRDGPVDIGKFRLPGNPRKPILRSPSYKLTHKERIAAQ